MNKCPCCKSKTIKELGHHEICNVCWWEDNPSQSTDPNLERGANRLCLNDYRENRSYKTLIKRWLPEIIAFYAIMIIIGIAAGAGISGGWWKGLGIALFAGTSVLLMELPKKKRENNFS
jgi:hypothetical protein